jgi:serine/threonine-protein kinase HipA
MKNNNCLYCYEPLDAGATAPFHARCSMAFFGTPEPPALGYSADQMAELAKNVVERSVAVPGVQPKISLSVVTDALDDGKRGRLTVVGALGGRYILKPPSDIYPEMPANEHLTMRMAEAFGIPTVPSSLMHMASGELAYITRRIDRTNTGEKIHMLDLFQVTEAYDKYKSSMEKVGKAIRQYATNTGLDLLSLFELVVFSFVTGNNDMHLKNFSLIRSGDDWKLSPAYDLLNVTIVNPGDDEELALPLEAKKKKLSREHFVRYGLGLQLNRRQIDRVFSRFADFLPTAERWVTRSFLSPEFQEKYIAVLRERMLRLQ